VYIERKSLFDNHEALIADFQELVILAVHEGHIVVVAVEVEWIFDETEGVVLVDD
jgi:hypothetical protein